jgi:Tol biopolymer transport system component
LGSTLGQARDGVKVEQKVLVTGEPGLQYWISPRGQHVAAMVLRGSRTVIVHDGVEGPRFDEILAQAGQQSRVVFSEDGERYAYVGRLGDEWVLLVDGKEVARGKPWADASNGPIVKLLGFTPGDRHVYVVTNSGDTSAPRAQLHIDGKAGPLVYGDSRFSITPIFSPDGERHVYATKVLRGGGGWADALVVDGTLTTNGIGRPQFSADGRLFMTLVQGPQTVVLADGKPYLQATGGIELRMAPVGSMVVAIVTQRSATGQTQMLVVDGKRVTGSECRGTFMGIYMSRDGKHWAGRCQDAGYAHWVMTDGKKGAQYQSATAVDFTQDGRPVYGAMMNQKQFVIVGEEEFGPYESVDHGQVALRDMGNPVQETGAARVVGNHVAFDAVPVGGNGFDRVVVINGKSFTARRATHPVVSPETGRHAYLAGNAPLHDVFVDGQQVAGLQLASEQSQIQGRPRITFSRDGKHVAFPAFTRDRRIVMAVDGKAVETPARTMHNPTFTPDASHLLWLATAMGQPRSSIYVDGESVFDFPRGGNEKLETGDPSLWSMSEQGVLSFIAQEGGAIKRISITPGSGSVQGMLSRAGRPK